MNFSPQPESFLAGLLVGLIVLAIVWLIVDRAALKAKVAALEAKAAPVVKAVEHDLSLAQAAVKVPFEDAKAVLQGYLADIRAEVAKIEAAKAIPVAPANPNVPTL